MNSTKAFEHVQGTITPQIATFRSEEPIGTGGGIDADRGAVNGDVAARGEGEGGGGDRDGVGRVVGGHGREGAGEGDHFSGQSAR